MNSKWLLLGAVAVVVLYIATRSKTVTGITSFAPPPMPTAGGVPTGTSSGPPGSQIITTLNAWNTAGCTAIAGAKVGNAAAAEACRLYGYISPLGQAETAYKYVAPAVVSGGKAVGNGVVTGAKAVGSAAATTASAIAGATKSVAKALNPFSW